jgi:hypothetical protein
MLQVSRHPGKVLLGAILATWGVVEYRTNWPDKDNRDNGNDPRGSFLHLPSFIRPSFIMVPSSLFHQKEHKFVELSVAHFRYRFLPFYLHLPPFLSSFVVLPSSYFLHHSSFFVLPSLSFLHVLLSFIFTVCYWLQ